MIYRSQFTKLQSIYTWLYKAHFPGINLKPVLSKKFFQKFWLGTMSVKPETLVRLVDNKLL